MIYQAGASPRGVRFAAENAEAIFIAGPSKRILAQTVSRVRDALEAARAKREEYLSSASIEGGLMFMSGWMESTDTAVAYDPVAGQGAQSGLIQAQRLVAAAAVHDGPFDEQWITDQYAAFLAARSDAAAKVTRLFLSDPEFGDIGGQFFATAAVDPTFAAALVGLPHRPQPFLPIDSPAAAYITEVTGADAGELLAKFVPATVG